MKKSCVKRIIAAVLMSAVSLGATISLGMPQISYAMAGKADEQTVLTINGTEIKMSEYAEFYSYCKSVMEMQTGMGEYIWSLYPDAEAQLRTMTEETLVRVHAVNDKFNELGLKVDSERGLPWYGTSWELMQAKKASNDMLAGMGSNLDKYLESLGVTEKFYDALYVVDYYVDALDNYYFGENGANAPDESEIQSEFENYYKSKNIMFLSIDSTGMYLSDEEMAEKKALAEEVLNEIKNGADFDEMMTKYNEDTGAAEYPEGYVFADDGSLLQELVDETKALEVGDVSDELVETAYGWHIVKREPLTDEDYEARRAEMVYNLTGESIETLILEWMDEAEIEYSEGGDSLTMTDVLGEDATAPMLDNLITGTEETTEDTTDSTDSTTEETPDTDAQTADDAAAE